MRLAKPKVYKHKNGTLEIVYSDRVELFKKVEGNPLTKKTLENEGHEVPKYMWQQFDDEYYKSNGFKKVNYDDKDVV